MNIAEIWLLISIQKIVFFYIVSLIKRFVLKTKELTRLYQTQFGDNTGTLSVYRRQRMHIGELQRL